MGLLERFGTRSTRFVGRHWGDRFPFYYVSEFPKSGGTWLAKMIADYLEIPKPTRTIFPMGCTCVIQNHWTYDSRLKRVVYLHRDGRDVAVSSYFHVLRALNGPTPTYALKLFPQSKGEHWTPDNAKEVLPSFLNSWCKRPFGCRTNWGDHISSWLKRKEEITPVSYEALRTNCLESLGKTIESVTGKETSIEKLEATILKYSFERQTGRKPGESDSSSHNRKGIIGDWKNYFTPESIEIFNRHFENEMKLAGYDENN